MKDSTIDDLNESIKELQNHFNLTREEALKIAIEIIKAEAIDDICLMFDEDGEFQTNIREIKKTLNLYLRQ